MVGVVLLQIAGAQFRSARLDDLRQGYRAVAWGNPLSWGYYAKMLFAGCGGRVDRLAQLVSQPEVLIPPKRGRMESPSNCVVATTLGYKRGPIRQRVLANLRGSNSKVAMIY
jgi:hypothetical protein